ncbi:MAG: hypothetical protein LBQ57_01525 [Spirochaetales bacterium]|jgi:hypothetical protein|nr:hypothetical protein [Spirochaetales bacterium]
MTRKIKLLVIDFAGTLSLETLLFGQDENLAAELECSGLAALGVSPGIFWKELVLPGWEEGSLTARGYTAVLAEHLCVFAQNRGTPAPEAVIHAAASSFAESYFTHSPVENAWKETLTRLAAAPGAITLIATDHYAEATAHIRGLLSAWNISSRPLLSAAETAVRPTPFIIANSADLGAHKAAAAFWKTVKASLEKSFCRGGCFQEIFSAIYIVDDFGFNENAADAYGGQEKALRRREKTAARVKDVLGPEPEVFSFFLEGRARAAGGKILRETYNAMVCRASEFLAPCSAS